MTRTERPSYQRSQLTSIIIHYLREALILRWVFSKMKTSYIEYIQDVLWPRQERTLFFQWGLRVICILEGWEIKGNMQYPQSLNGLRPISTILPNVNVNWCYQMNRKIEYFREVALQMFKKILDNKTAFFSKGHCLWYASLSQIFGVIFVCLS